jgi:hypothetical protein
VGSTSPNTENKEIQSLRRARKRQNRRTNQLLNFLSKPNNEMTFVVEHEKRVEDCMLQRLACRTSKGSAKQRYGDLEVVDIATEQATVSKTQLLAEVD